MDKEEIQCQVGKIKHCYDEGFKAGIKYAIQEIAKEEGWEESEKYYLNKLLTFQDDQ